MTLVEVRVHADGEAAEAVSELFNRLVPGGAVIEVLLPGESAPPSPHDRPLPAGEGGEFVDFTPGNSEIVVKTYLLPSDNQAHLRQTLEEGLWHLRVIYPFSEPEFHELAEADWAEAWKQDYTPQRIGRRLVIVPSWLDYAPKPGDLIVRLDPGMAFGTGLHPSTRLCAAALEDLVRPGDRVLDVGTGSGILAIAAAQLGAAQALGLDIDPIAVRVARENAAANGVAGLVEVEDGSIRGETFTRRGAWSLVVANIIAPVIVDLAPDLATCLAPGGRVVVSGIIAGQSDAVALALAAAGLSVSDSRREGDWVALVAARP